MARRQSATGEAHVAAAGETRTGVAPNVSAFFRAYWPPNAADEEVDEALHAALVELLTNMRTQRRPDADERINDAQVAMGRLRGILGHRPAEGEITVDAEEVMANLLRIVGQAGDAAAAQARMSGAIPAEVLRAGVQAALKCAIGNGLVSVRPPDEWPRWVAIDPPYWPVEIDRD